MKKLLLLFFLILNSCFLIPNMFSPVFASTCYIPENCTTISCKDKDCPIKSPPVRDTKKIYDELCICKNDSLPEDLIWEKVYKKIDVSLAIKAGGYNLINPALVPTVGSGDMGESILAKILIAIIRIFFIIGSIAVLIYFLLGGLAWITSGGEKSGLENAKTKFTAGFIGIVIIASLYAITKILADVVGIEFFKTFIITWPTIQ